LQVDLRVRLHKGAVLLTPAVVAHHAQPLGGFLGEIPHGQHVVHHQGRAVLQQRHGYHVPCQEAVQISGRALLLHGIDGFPPKQISDPLGRVIGQAVA